MKILVAPLNWGLGHASRCVPLISQWLEEGHEVVLGGDGESLTLLRQHFPQLRYIPLAPLRLRYSKGKQQVWAILKHMPCLLLWAFKDHLLLRAVLRTEFFDRVVSDNRFGLYNKITECIYITHQLHIFLPKGWRWAEHIASLLHARIYARYNKVWVPDYAERVHSLAGELSHTDNNATTPAIEFIGPLSRFSSDYIQKHSQAVQPDNTYTIVAVLSGLEPQRTLLERELMSRYQGAEERVLIVQGLVNRPNTRIKHANITTVPHMSDRDLASALRGAKHIIARSGYSTIMDLHALGLLKTKGQPIKTSIELIPTPGQPEQEYLAQLHSFSHKITLKS
jgi:hypothetical protein